MGKNDLKRCDAAYLCFSFTAMVILWAFAYGNKRCGDGCGPEWGFALFVVYPLFLAALITAVTGISLSLPLSRHWPLGLLSVLVVLSFAVSWMFLSGAVPVPEAAVLALLFTFAIASIVSALMWFFVGRRRASSRGSL